MWSAGAYHGRSCPTALAWMPLLAAALDDSAFAIVLLANFRTWACNIDIETRWNTPCKGGRSPSSWRVSRQSPH